MKNPVTVMLLVAAVTLTGCAGMQQTVSDSMPFMGGRTLSAEMDPLLDNGQSLRVNLPEPDMSFVVPLNAEIVVTNRDPFELAALNIGNLGTSLHLRTQGLSVRERVPFQVEDNLQRFSERILDSIRLVTTQPVLEELPTGTIPGGASIRKVKLATNDDPARFLGFFLHGGRGFVVEVRTGYDEALARQLFNETIHSVRSSQVSYEPLKALPPHRIDELATIVALTDTEQAVELIRYAASQDSPRAQARLANVIMDELFDGDTERRLARESAIADAEKLLAEIGASVDSAEKWARSAQYRAAPVDVHLALGKVYEFRGRVLAVQKRRIHLQEKELDFDRTAFLLENPQLKEAVNWYRQAAQDGSAEAALRLSAFYRNGWGVAVNIGQARIWEGMAESHASATETATPRAPQVRERGNSGEGLRQLSID